MSNTKFIKIGIKTGILELSSIVTSDMLDLQPKLVEALEENRLKTSCTSCFVSDDMHPCVTRILINDDKAI